MIKGQPIFDGIAVMEFSCTFYGGSLLPLSFGEQVEVHLEAKAAFVQSADVGERKGGATHGYTTSSRGWSAETMKKLVELRDAMERDLAGKHFSVINTGALASDEIAGIGESLTDEDGTRQI